MLRHNKVEEATQVYAKAIEVEPDDIGFITDAVLGLKDAGHVGAAAAARARRGAQSAGGEDRPDRRAARPRTGRPAAAGGDPPRDAAATTGAAAPLPRPVAARLGRAPPQPPAAGARRGGGRALRPRRRRALREHGAAARRHGRARDGFPATPGAAAAADRAGRAPRGDPRRRGGMGRGDPGARWRRRTRAASPASSFEIPDLTLPEMGMEGSTSTRCWVPEPRLRRRSAAEAEVEAPLDEAVEALDEEVELELDLSPAGARTAGWRALARRARRRRAGARRLRGGCRLRARTRAEPRSRSRRRHPGSSRSSPLGEPSPVAAVLRRR